MLKMSLKNPIHFEPKVNLFTPREPTVGTVVENTRLTPADDSPRRRPIQEGYTDVRHIVLSLKQDAYPFRAGQSAGIIAPGSDLQKVARGSTNTRHTIRLYSIASPTGGEYGDGKSIGLTITRDNVWDDEGKVVHHGVCSNFLCDRQVGDEVSLTGPSGKSFLLPEEMDRPLVFIATGTGIAPFRGMLMDLSRMGFEREVWLFFGLPYRDEILYHALFQDLVASMPHFRYINAISREEKNPRGGKMYVTHRLEEHRDELRRLQQEGCLVYICGGPKGMENGVIPILRAVSADPDASDADWKKAGIRDKRILIETY